MGAWVLGGRGRGGRLLLGVLRRVLASLESSGAWRGSGGETKQRDRRQLKKDKYSKIGTYR